MRPLSSSFQFHVRLQGTPHPKPHTQRHPQGSCSPIWVGPPMTLGWARRAPLSSWLPRAEAGGVWSQGDSGSSWTCLFALSPGPRFWATFSWWRGDQASLVSGAAAPETLRPTLQRWPQRPSESPRGAVRGRPPHLLKRIRCGKTITAGGWPFCFSRHPKAW